jgi:hypothetical protein
MLVVAQETDSFSTDEIGFLGMPHFLHWAKERFIIERKNERNKR